MDEAGDRVAELDFGIADCVPADNRAARRAAALQPAADDLAEERQRKLVVGKADKVERCLRRAAHRVHIAQRVGRRDLAVQVRIVHDGREKVDRLDERQLVGETVHPRVIARLGADEHVRVVTLRQVAQHLRDPLRGKLAGSTRARGVIDQSLFAAEQEHTFTLKDQRLASPRLADEFQKPLTAAPEHQLAESGQDGLVRLRIERDHGDEIVGILVPFRHAPVRAEPGGQLSW